MINDYILYIRIETVAFDKDCTDCKTPTFLFVLPFFFGRLQKRVFKRRESRRLHLWIALSNFYSVISNSIFSAYTGLT